MIKGEKLETNKILIKASSVEFVWGGENAGEEPTGNPDELNVSYF